MNGIQEHLDKLEILLIEQKREFGIGV